MDELTLCLEGEGLRAPREEGEGAGMARRIVAEWSSVWGGMRLVDFGVDRLPLFNETCGGCCDNADVGDETFKLESDDSLFSIPDYVPTELPDLAALGTGTQTFLKNTCRFINIVLLE